MSDEGQATRGDAEETLPMQSDKVHDGHVDGDDDCCGGGGDDCHGGGGSGDVGDGSSSVVGDGGGGDGRG